MGVSNRWNIYAVNFSDVSDTLLTGISGGNINLETNMVSEVVSGQVYAEHLVMNGQEVTADFSSMSIQDCLDQVGPLGFDISTLSNGFYLYGYKHAKGGARAAGSVHRRFTFVDGLIVPRSITCDHQGDASINYDVLATYDGTNNPLQFSDTIAAPTVPSDNERFTLGKVSIAGTEYTGKKSIEIDFGNQVERESADSDKWSTHSSIVQQIPEITIRGISLDWLAAANIPLEGRATTHANTTIWLRKRAKTASGFVADGTAEHISFTIDGCAWVEEAYSSQGQGAVETQLKIRATYDGTNTPLVIDTTATIT